MRGQIAFESLLLLLIVLSAATILLTTYLETNEETLALGYARTKVLEEITKTNKNVFIEKIWLEKQNKERKIIVELSEETIIDSKKIEEFIQEKTNLKNVQIELITQ